jgi:hypothetical protein
MAVREARPMAQVATAMTADLAFEEFFEAERGRLFGAVYLMTGSVEEDEEIVQDAFLAVWERWDRVRGMDRGAGGAISRVRRGEVCPSCRLRIRMRPWTCTMRSCERSGR